VAFMENNGKIIIDNPIKSTISEAQEAFAGLSDELGLKSEEDVIELCRDVREKMWENNNAVIEYKSSKIFQSEELKNLFLSVKWESGQYPEKLVEAMKNSATVFSVWDYNRLVGLINVLDDGIMTAYIHFLLVDPEYQGKGIGKELLLMTKKKYKDYLRIVLVSDDKEIGFYQNSGFDIGKNTTAMFINKF